MTPCSPSPSTSVPPSERGAPPDGRAADARRRRALLQVAGRSGEVRVRLRDGAGVHPRASEVLQLLDGLNEGGLLRYGGLRQDGQGVDIVYLPA